MSPQIKVRGGLRIKRAATISDNAKVKDTLRLTKLAIQQGKLDDIITLDTWDRNGEGRIVNRIMTISEIDQHIDSIRQSKIDAMDYALQQVDLFSKYLKKNVHAANNGYSLDMIMQFISTDDLYKLVATVLEQTDEIKSKGFVEGQYNNIRGGPETLLDRIVISLQNAADMKRGMRV